MRRLFRASVAPQEVVQQVPMAGTIRFGSCKGRGLVIASGLVAGIPEPGEPIQGLGAR
jgi:hypothetical protein